MISASTNNLTHIWSHAKNVRANFSQHSRYEEPALSYYGFDLFGGDEYYYYDDESTTESTTEAPNNKADTRVKYYSNPDSKNFINQENIERNYKIMYRLLNSNYNDTANTETSNFISDKFMKNVAHVFVFLNSNPETVRDNYLERLFHKIIEEEPFKGVLMANQLIKKISTVQKDITTNFFTKLASLIGFQYSNYNHALDKFSFSIQSVQGIFSCKSSSS